MTRRSAATAAACLLLTGCTSGHAHAPPKPATPSTLTASTPVAGKLRCGNPIDTHAPPAGFEVVLGVVALPSSPSHPALQTIHTGEGHGPRRLFAKTGLIIRSRTTFELIVPAQVADHMSIGWGGAPATPGHRVVVSNCTTTADSRWLAYAGGYWIDRPACVPLIVKVGTRQQQVRIGLGAPCPGQQPPQGQPIVSPTGFAIAQVLASTGLST